MKVLIDAGHGYDTPGKRSPDGVFREYSFNRDVAYLVITELHHKGIDCDMLVSETFDVPLDKRVKRANDVCNLIGASNVLVVSIHSNAAGNGSQWMSAKGWSCYTSKGQTKSDKVAECLYDAFEKEFSDRKIRTDRSDGDRDWEADFYILKHTRCAAVLLENFFYDNQEECSWLLMEDTQKRIAKAIADGIEDYINKLS